MADLEITWRGLTFGNDDSGIDVANLTGWDDLPDTTDMSQPRTRGHGDHVGDLYSRARVVTVNGNIASRANRDGLAAAIIAASSLSSTVEDLTITSLGRTLTAGARVIARTLPIAEDYASGLVPFMLQWRCPNPLRFGPEQSASTHLPEAGGGLAWPLFGSGFLDWGAPGTPGQITLTNPGDADAGIVFEIAGGSTVGLQLGFEISSDDGQRITYPTFVPPGQTLTADTDDGSVLAEGATDRTGELTRADWMLVPRADPKTGAPGRLIVQFTSLGGERDAGSLLTARWKETNG